MYGRTVDSAASEEHCAGFMRDTYAATRPHTFRSHCAVTHQCHVCITQIPKILHRDWRSWNPAHWWWMTQAQCGSTTRTACWLSSVMCSSLPRASPSTCRQSPSWSLAGWVPGSSARGWHSPAGCGTSKICCQKHGLLVSTAHAGASGHPAESVGYRLLLIGSRPRLLLYKENTKHAFFQRRGPTYCGKNIMKPALCASVMSVEQHYACFSR